MDIELKNLVPLYCGIRSCMTTDHVHVELGVISTVPPAPGQNAWEKDGEFFYPMGEFVTCLN